MPKDKERAANPAAAQRKLEKQRALKKGKAAVAAQRTERLAHRNPDRLQRQIDEYKDLQSKGSELSTRDKTHLADLERDVARIRKAKDLIGDNWDRSDRAERTQGSHSQNDRDSSRQVLGKRERSPRRDQHHGDSHGTRNHRERDRHRRSRSRSSSATDVDVRHIPMPRDTPPPLPPRQRRQQQRQHPDSGSRTQRIYAAAPGADGKPLRAAMQPRAQAVYEAKPVMRDLQREAVGFVPNAVKRKLDVVGGAVGQPLIEPEELDRLESQGYRPKQEPQQQSQENQNQDPEEEEKSSQRRPTSRTQTPTAIQAAAKKGGHDNNDDDEMDRFNKEVRQVQIEEVEDEDA